MTEKKESQSKKKKPLSKHTYMGAGVVVLVVIAALFLVYQNNAKAQITQEAYETFTCSCCETNLLDSPCFLAGGMREYIDGLVDAGMSKEEVIYEGVRKFGVPSLVEEDLWIDYGTDLLNNTPEHGPNLSIEPLFVDMGNLSNSKGIVIKDFFITNEGDEDLIIYDLKTSCACLTASFIRDGQESVRVGRFSHSDGWTYIIKPGEKVTLRTFWDPRVTNWQLGHVERIVTITSNDPLHWETGVKLAAELVP